MTPADYDALFKALDSPVPKMESVWGSFSDEELAEAQKIVAEIIPNGSPLERALFGARSQLERDVAAWVSHQFDLAQMLLAGDAVVEILEAFEFRYGGFFPGDDRPLRPASIVNGMRQSLAERRITVAVDALGRAIAGLCIEAWDILEIPAAETLLYWCARLCRKIPFVGGWKCPMEWPIPSPAWLTYMQAYTRWLAGLIPPANFPSDTEMADWCLWDENDERRGGWPEPWWGEYIRQARISAHEEREAALSA